MKASLFPHFLSAFNVRKFASLSLLALAASASNSLAIDYTWEGTAGDGDWTNAANWDANGIPVDDQAGIGNSDGLTLSDTDNIIFTGTTMPSLNIPLIGGNYDATNAGLNSTPTMIFNNAGAISLTSTGRDSGFWTNRVTVGNRTVMTVGDGSGAAGEVTVTINACDNSNRHGANTTHNFQVNADGVLNFGQRIDFSFSNGETAAPNRFSTITIDGGSVDVTGWVWDATNARNFVNFTAPGGSFTADFDATSDFPDIAAVNASLGFTDAAGTAFFNSAGGNLQAVDNLDGSFTVTAVAGTDPNHWTGNGGPTWDEAPTINFTLNAEAAPLLEATFGVAKAVQDRVTFADAYFDSGVSQAVTQNAVTIAAGGVETGTVDFLNSAVAYTLGSSDANGITGATSVLHRGGGTVTYLGTHTYSGATFVGAGSTVNVGDGTTDGSISNSAVTLDGTLVFNHSSALSQDGAIGGAGTLEKLGSGTLTLTSASTHTGQVIVTEGELLISGSIGSSSYDIAAGAVVNLGSVNGGALLNYPASPTFRGAGILRKTGDSRIRWAGQIATFELASDALIDVQEGTLVGGSNANEVWTANLADLNIAAGATFDGVEASVRVDALTGDGTLRSGFNNPAYVDGFTIGVDNGSGTFNGVIQNASIAAQIFKEGTGTQTLTGVNTYTGSTTIEDGTLILAAGGQLRMLPTGNGVSNVITGGAPSTGTINLDGTLNLDLSGADLTNGNSWLLVDDTNLTVNYGGTFAVSSPSGAFTENAGVWTLSETTNTWVFTESTGTLVLASQASIYDSWAVLNGLTGADALATADPDSDFIDNLLEFAFGTNPNAPDPVSLTWDGTNAATPGCPMVDLNFSGGTVDLNARFLRRKDHGTVSSLQYEWEFSADLVTWESSASTPAWLVTPTDLADDVSGDYDLVTVPFPALLDNGEIPQFFRVRVIGL
jgi:autotransporter-associated beta strand protein